MLRQIQTQSLICRSTLKSSVNETRTQANKCSTTQDSRNRNHYLTVAHLNVRSMASRENFHLIEQIVVNYDIFTISETWLDPSVCDSDLNVPGHILTRQDRGPQKKGGGLIVLNNKPSTFFLTLKQVQSLCA